MKVITFDKGSKKKLQKIRWTRSEIASAALLTFVVIVAAYGSPSGMHRNYSDEPAKDTQLGRQSASRPSDLITWDGSENPPVHEVQVSERKLERRLTPSLGLPRCTVFLHILGDFREPAAEVSQRQGSIRCSLNSRGNSSKCPASTERTAHSTNERY